MSTTTSQLIEVAGHLPAGATVVLDEVAWEEYEHLLEELRGRPNLRVAYDRGKVEIMSPLPEHEEYGRFVDELVRAVADALQVELQKYGAATWKRQKAARGVEPDACYYVTHAKRVISKRRFDLDVDPPPDIVVEIDITSESLSKFPIYAALGVPEIWRYDGQTFQFFRRDGDQYRIVAVSVELPPLIPGDLEAALSQCKSDGQTAALHAFRKHWRENRNLG